MKDADIIRAVAEFDGWKFIPSHDDARGNAMPECWTHDETESTCWEFSSLPPYLTSLDAIVPVTEKLTVKDRHLFRTNLINMLETPTGWEVLSECNATARQRCEALLITIGKWRDE